MSDKEFEEITRIAHSIAHGGMKTDIFHCIEENSFYIYKNEFWKKLFDVELSKIIIEHPDYRYITKHSISQRNNILENLKVLLQMRFENLNKNGYLNFDFGEFDTSYPYPFSNPAGAWHPHKKENYSNSN